MVGRVQPSSVQSLTRLVALHSSWRDARRSSGKVYSTFLAVSLSVLPVVAGSTSVSATLLLRVYSTLVHCRIFSA